MRKIKAEDVLYELIKDKEYEEEISGRTADEEKELYTLTYDFLKDKEDLKRKKFFKDLVNGRDITGEKGIRRKLAAIDLEYFGRAYFPHYFTRESASFHKELDSIWTDSVLKGIDPYYPKDALKIDRLSGNKRAVAAPRGHAKSTNLTFKDSMHAVLYKYKHFILIISDVYDQAAGFLEKIKNEIEDNQRIEQDFGKLSGKVWREDVILTSTNIKLLARGSNQKVRGITHKQYRPDLIICDDIENDELVRTKEQRKKLENWYFKALSKSGDTYTDIIYIGTVLHYDSLLSKLLANTGYKSVKYKAVISFAKNMELWDIWEKLYTNLADKDREADADKYYKEHEKLMLEGTKVLWEKKLSYLDLIKIKIDEGEGAFNSEFQNEPINPEDCLFNEEWFEYYNPFEINFADKKYEFYGFVDPSLGKSNSSDYSAIISLAKDKNTGFMYVVDADIQRRHPDNIIKDIINKCKYIKAKYKKEYSIFGAETNQFQWYFKEQLIKESAKQRIYLNIEEVKQTADKTLRIQSLQIDIKNKYILFNKKHKLLLEQLKQFPLGSHDDGPDALEAARALAVKSGNKLKLLDIRLFGF